LLVTAWLLIALAVNVPMLYAGRVVAGFCVGVVSLCFPVYLGETLQPEVRGMLGLLPTAFGNVGKLAQPTSQRRWMCCRVTDQSTESELDLKRLTCPPVHHKYLLIHVTDNHHHNF
jgi:hypothetical protein